MASKDEVRRQLYAVGDMLDKSVEIELGLFLPIKTYLKTCWSPNKTPI
jgi:hypothetical protein